VSSLSFWRRFSARPDMYAAGDQRPPGLNYPEVEILALEPSAA
jgi:hypothetical protein